eukprot:gene46523-58012_t
MFMQTRKVCQLQAAEQFFGGPEPLNVRAAVLDATLQDFVDLGISVESLVAKVGFTIQYCMHAINAAITNIKADSFCGSVTADPAYAWLQSCLLLELRHSPSPCVSIDMAQSVVEKQVHHMVHANEQLILLQTKCSEAMGDASQLPGMLSWDQSFVTSVESLTQVELRDQMPHHFMRRTKATPQMFWHRIHHDDRYATLSFLGQRGQSLTAESA